MNWKAYYDPDLDVIVNAKEGTLEWWHERGHQVLHRNKLGFALQCCWNALEFVLIGVSAVSLGFLMNNFFLQACGVFFLAWKFVHELWAWFYAFRHYNGPGRLRKKNTIPSSEKPKPVKIKSKPE